MVPGSPAGEIVSNLARLSVAASISLAEACRRAGYWSGLLSRPIPSTFMAVGLIAALLLASSRSAIGLAGNTARSHQLNPASVRVIRERIGA
jgi:hypothetical protein